MLSCELLSVRPVQQEGMHLHGVKTLRGAVRDREPDVNPPDGPAIPDIDGIPRPQQLPTPS